MTQSVTHLKTTTRIIDLFEGDTKHIKAMSVEELRVSEHFQDYSEDQLLAMIDTVRNFTEIVYSAWARQRQEVEQAPKIIQLQQQQRKAA